MTGTLFLVPNLLGVVPPGDVLPARTIAIARRLTHWIVETPKPARAFIKTLDHERAISELAMQTFEDHSALAWLSQGHDVGVLSDAGCPGIAGQVAHRESLGDGADAEDQQQEGGGEMVGRRRQRGDGEEQAGGRGRRAEPRDEDRCTPAQGRGHRRDHQGGDDQRQ